MKRSRKINISARNYLLKRNYSNIERPKSKTCSLKELMNKVSCCEDSFNTSIISYASLKEDLLLANQHFIQFLDTITHAPSSLQADLKSLLPPLFVHLYLELVFCGHVKEAELFYENSKLFATDNHDIILLIKIIASLKTRQHITSNTSVNDFRKRKFEVSMSSPALKFFEDYITSGCSMLLLQIVNSHINIIIDGYNEDIVDDNEEKLASQVPTVNLLPVGESVDTSFSKTAVKLKNCVCTPAVCAYRLHNPVANITCACVSPNDVMLSCGLEDSTLQLWRIRADLKPNIHPLQLHSDPDSYSETFKRQLWDISEEDIAYPIVLRGHSSSVYAVSFMSNHQWLLSASHDCSVRLWDVKQRQDVVSYVGHSYPVFSVESSPISSLFASASYDQTAKLWSTERIFPLRNFIGHLLAVNCLQFHPNGNYLATGSSDMTIRLWDVQEGKCVRLMQDHRGAVYCLAFSPDGKIMASGGEDRIIRIWDLGMGRVLKTLTSGHQDVISSLAFNKSSTILTSGGLDGNLCIWDVGNCEARNKKEDNKEDEEAASNLIESFPSNFSTILNISYSTNNYFQTVSRVT